MEFTTAKTYQEIAKELTAYTKTSNEDYYEYGIFVDGMEYSEWMWANGHGEKADGKLTDTTTLEGFNAVMDSQNTGHFTPSDNGVLTQVFVTDKVEYFNTQGNWVVEPGKVYVTCINTYLAEVDTSVDHDTGEFTTRVSYFDSVMKDSNGVDDIGLVKQNMSFSVSTSEGFEEEGIVMIQASAQGMTASDFGGGYSSDMEVIHINEAIVMEGTVTSSKLSAEYVGGSWMVLDDDQTYSYSVGMRGDLNLNSDGVTTPGAGDEVVAYFDANLDENGNPYVLGYTKVEAAPQYLYVEENYDWNYYDGVIARVTFADGEEAVIKISEIDGDNITNNNQAEIPDSARFKDGAGDVISANENFQGTWNGNTFVPAEGENGGLVVENRVFAYTQLSDGSYSVTTDIQKAYDEDNGAAKGGMLEMTNGDQGTLASTTNGVPVKDTMAIFSSVYMPEDAVTADGATYKSKYAVPGNETETGYYAFAFEKNYNTAFDLDTTVFGREVKDENADPYNEIHGDREYTTASGWNWDNGEYDSLFAVNSNTVFVDVVNNDYWTGYKDDRNDMDDYNINMQVVFGTNGIADVVFINNGFDPVSEDGYFILTDTQPEDYLDEDGNKIYRYNVWIDGEETYFESKGKEIDVTNKYDFFERTEKLQTNTLYYISVKDADGYVREVDFRYDYSPITNVLYDEDDYDAALSAGTVTDVYGDGGEGIAKNLVYNNHWSVATVVSGGYLNLKHDDKYANNAGEHQEGMWDGNDESGEDDYRYDDSTVFVILEANKNGDVYNIKRGSASDIKTYSSSRNNTSWVDVVEASNTGTTNPYAELVVVLQPWPVDSATVFVGDFTFNFVTGTGAHLSDPYIMSLDVAKWNGQDFFSEMSDAEKEAFRKNAFEKFIEDLHEDQVFTWSTVTNMSTSTSTFFRVERVLTNGTIVEEFYELNDNYIKFETENGGDGTTPETDDDAVETNYDWTQALGVDKTHVTELDNEEEFFVDLSNREAVVFHYTGEKELTEDEILALIKDAIVKETGLGEDARFSYDTEYKVWSLTVEGSVNDLTFDVALDAGTWTGSTVKEAIMYAVYDVAATNSAESITKYLLASGKNSHVIETEIVASTDYTGGDLGVCLIVEEGKTPYLGDDDGLGEFDIDNGDLLIEHGMIIYTDLYTATPSTMTYTKGLTTTLALANASDLIYKVNSTDDKSYLLEEPVWTYTIQVAAEKVPGYGADFTITGTNYVSFAGTDLSINTEKTIISVNPDAVTSTGYLPEGTYTITLKGESVTAPEFSVDAERYYYVLNDKVVAFNGAAGTFVDAIAAAEDGNGASAGTGDVTVVTRGDTSYAMTGTDWNALEDTIYDTKAYTANIKHGDIIDTKYSAMTATVDGGLARSEVTGLTCSSSGAEAVYLYDYTAGSLSETGMAVKVTTSTTATYSFTATVLVPNTMLTGTDSRGKITASIADPGNADTLVFEALTWAKYDTDKFKPNATTNPQLDVLADVAQDQTVDLNFSVLASDFNARTTSTDDGVILTFTFDNGTS